jgi:hypothetical protein
MEKLAKLANLPNGYYSRYDENIVGYLCKGDVESVQEEYNQGFATKAEIDGIAKALGMTQASSLHKRSDIGMSYGYSRKKFSDMGLCEACADNAAVYYTEKPASRCGKLAKQALEGNPAAIRTLQSFPDYCNVATGDTTSTPEALGESSSASSAISVNDFILDEENYREGQPASVYGLPMCINGENCALYTNGSGVNSLAFTYQIPRTDKETLLTCNIISNPCRATISGTINHDSFDNISIEVTSITWSWP